VSPTGRRRRRVATHHQAARSLTDPSPEPEEPLKSVHVSVDRVRGGAAVLERKVTTGRAPARRATLPRRWSRSVLRAVAIGSVLGIVTLAGVGTGLARGSDPTASVPPTTQRPATEPAPSGNAPCRGDLVKVEMGGEDVECRTAAGDVVCIISAQMAAFVVCPPELPMELVSPPIATADPEPTETAAQLATTL